MIKLDPTLFTFEKLQYSIQFIWYRKLIQDTIFDAELMKARSTVDEKIILANYATEIGIPFVSKELHKVIRRLKNNQEKYVAYSEYFPPDVIMLFSTPKVDIGRLVRTYAPVRRLIDKNSRAIQAALMLPLVLFTFIVLVLGGAISEFKGSGISDFTGVAGVIANHFYLINTILLFAFILGFFIYPRKLPILKGAYLRLDSLLALSLIEIQLQLNVTMPMVIAAIKKQFGIQTKKGSGYIDELVDILDNAKLINRKDKADIKLAAAYTDKIEIITLKKEDRLDDAKRFNDIVGDLVKQISVIFMVIPAIEFLMVLFELGGNAAGQLGQMQ